MVSGFKRRGPRDQVWDSVDEEWAFGDGRLALRGHNGSEGPGTGVLSRSSGRGRDSAAFGPVPGETGR